MQCFFPAGFCQIKEHCKLDVRLSYEQVKNAKILPELADGDWKNFYVQLHSNGFVVDENNCYVPISSNHRVKIGCRSTDVVEAPVVVETRNKGIYLGCLISHYGHFILEGLNRLYFLMNLDNYQDYDLVYHTYKNEDVPLLRKFFLWLGIPTTKLKHVSQTTYYKELIIPEVSTEIEQFWTTEYKNTIDHLIRNISPIYNDKLYLSRLKFEDALIGEKAIVKTFRKNGYKIIYPEKLPLEKQIALIKGARDIACVSGTTAHNFIFAQDGIKSCVFERYSEFNKAQLIVNDMRGLDASHVKAGYDFVPTNYGYGPFLIGITRFVREYFDKNKFIYNVKDMQLYKRFLYLYLKYWSTIYATENGLSFLRFNHKNLSNEMYTALLKKVSHKLKVGKSKLSRSDKKINLNIYHIKLSMYKILAKVTYGQLREKCIVQKKVYKHKLSLCKKLLGK